MTPVEVCGICDIAGCHHIRERKAAAGLSGTLPDATSALDALVEVIDHLLHNYLLDEHDEPDLCVDAGHWLAIHATFAALARVKGVM